MQQYTPTGPSAEARLGPNGAKITGRSRTILSLQIQPRLPAGTLVLLQPTAESPLGDSPILQEVQEDGSLSVLADNEEQQELDLAPNTFIGSVQEVTPTPSTIDAETSSPPEATTHSDFDALPQSAKIKRLVARTFKKNGKEICWAVDYRRLIAVTKKDAFPLPNIADNLSLLSGSRNFLALDGARAFHEVPVRRADREKTAFSSPFGQYQFIKMPFGLANAPATYSRLVAKALCHLSSSEVLCYLDDTAIHSADPWSHLWIVRKVLAAFRAAGLQISPEKAQLFQDHIKYLGHEVTARGISIPPEYTSVIKDWPIPNTLKTLRAFLGKCGYYRRFIVDYATISAPLVQYTKHDQH